jgi:hypothetical protein
LGRLVQESMHTPKAFIEYDPNPPGNSTGGALGPPLRPDYPAGQHLQALEVVKEGFRRAIQSAMGSNFLPTSAQRRNEKSGVALDKMAQAASTGTFHFVNNYEDMIRQVGVITEDLIDKYYDFAGETSVMNADESAETININTDDQDAISTKGDYLVTVSTGPSTDSEREEVREFADTLVSNLQMIAGVSGPQAAAKVFGKAIRLRNGGPMMDALADVIDPPPPPGEDGKPIPPEMQALMGQLQQVQQQLQQAGQIIQQKQVEAQAEMTKQQAADAAKFKTEQMKAEADERVASLKVEADERGKAMDLLVKQAAQESNDAVKSQEIALKVRALEIELDTTRAKLMSAERIATQTNQVRLDTAAQARRKTIVNTTVNKGEDGEVLGTRAVHEEIEEPLG